MWAFHNGWYIEELFKCSELEGGFAGFGDCDDVDTPDAGKDDQATDAAQLTEEADALALLHDLEEQKKIYSSFSELKENPDAATLADHGETEAHAPDADVDMADGVDADVVHGEGVPAADVALMSTLALCIACIVMYLIIVR